MQNNHPKMKSEEMKSPLLMNTTVMNIQPQKEKESAFIVRYNQVITAYNRYAQEGQPKMEVMVGNKFITKVSHYLSKPLYIITFALIMMLVPLINIFCLGCIFAYLFYLRRENKKHVRNLSRVKDPFQNFFFNQEMCDHLGKHHTLLKLEQNQINGFTFNEELRTKLTQKLKQKTLASSSEGLTVLIYDQYFYDSFYLYRKEYYKTLIWATAGVILLCLSVFIYMSLFFY